jgi:iron complex transport system substrate-binding protein
MSVATPLRIAVALAVTPAFLLLAGCNEQQSGQNAATSKQSFMNVGEFAVTRKEGHIVVRDGAGRTLALVPRGQPAPAGFAPTQVIETPVRRAVTYRAFEIGILKALGEADSVVGVTSPRDKWFIDEVLRGFDEGRIAYIGEYNSIDYERVKTLHPDVVMTWDPSIIPMMDSLGIPVVVTSTPIATCLNTQMRFVQFIAPFFGREKEADAYFKRVSDTLADIRHKTKDDKKPNVMWGDIYEKRVLVEPGNAWVAELIGIAQSDYLFEDVYGTSCIEISTERFLSSGEQADLYFTYRTPQNGATSKAALARLNPLIANIRPLGPGGRAYAPLPIYSQSADRLDEIMVDISAILHPSIYPDYRLKFFQPLPDTDPKPGKEG